MRPPKRCPTPTTTRTASIAGERTAQDAWRRPRWQIVIADVSMSLDNVLAVAGAARDHPTVLIIGLILSIALMGFAATFIARLLHRYRWIAYIGLLDHPLRRARHDLSRRRRSLAGASSC